MAYKLVVDSCCDITDDMKEWENLEIVPLTLQIGDYVIKDDSDFDQDDFINRMVSSNELAKSACPSPEAFAKACEGDYDEIYLLTITDKLSGTYNSALQGVEIYRDENGSEKKIHVFNSLATSGLETIMAHKIKELADILRGCVKGGHFRNARLQKDPYICKIHGQGHFVFDGKKTQRIHIKGRCAHYICTGSPAYLQHSAGNQQLYGLPDRASSHAKTFPELKFVGKLCTGLKGCI